MTRRQPMNLGALVIGTMALASGAAEAAFVEVDDFEGLVLGPIDGQNGWFADDLLSEVTFDPADAQNQVLSIVTSSTFLFHAAAIPEGEARTLFLRFRYEDQLSVSFGMSESTFPDQFGNFEPELSLTSANDDLRINDGGTYSTVTSLTPGHWYNCWLYVDNDADVTSVWLHDRPLESAIVDDQLTIDGRTEFPFRQGTVNDLRNLFIKTGGGDGVSGPLILDDISLQSSGGVDLSYPTDIVLGAGLQPSLAHLRGAWPNPFNPQTTIAFTLDDSQMVGLSVYDLNGRFVRLLDAGVRESGNHVVLWNGRDQAGAGVASGIYFVRLTSRTEVQTVKLTLVR
ncbi:T9SS type A sorting domain-containing protein [bacterium]|nr:T9SS type A sorting domain-containing protein [bacterium]